MAYSYAMLKVKKMSPALYEYLVSVVPKENILENEPMSEHTSFKIGGPATLYIIPDGIQGNVCTNSKILWFQNRLFLSSELSLLQYFRNRF